MRAPAREPNGRAWRRGTEPDLYGRGRTCCPGEQSLKAFGLSLWQALTPRLSGPLPGVSPTGTGAVRGPFDPEHPTMTIETHCAARRGFLGSLARLPLIGGSIAVLGAPTASAEPVTDRLLARYDAWLEIERAHLRIERFGYERVLDQAESRFALVWHNRETGQIFDHRRDGLLGSGHRCGEPAPSTRATVVLAAAGVDWL